jgi:iron complex outermembrane receptor protein
MNIELRKQFRRVAGLAFAGAIAAGTTSMAEVAYAQTGAESDQLQEVVVTAERREQDVQKIAASVSVRSGEDLKAQGRYTLDQILENIPGVQGGAAVNPGTSAGSGTDSIANGVVIRGIRSNGGGPGSTVSVASSAATYVDDVYQGLGGNYDIGRVEVLRGPQGTLYGRSAVSGAVGTYTVDPEINKFGGTASAEVAENDVGAQSMRHYTGAVNMPLSDQFAVRLAGNFYNQGGIWLDDSSGKNKQSAAKIKALWKPNENISLLVGGAFENNTRYSGTGTSGSGVTITQPQPDQVVVTRTALSTLYPSYTDSRQLWAKLDWNLGFATLTYIPAVRTYTNVVSADLSANSACRTSTTAQLAAAGNIICFTSVQKTPFDEFNTHEIRLASNPDSKLTWQAGGMYYLNNLRNHGENNFVSPVDGQNYYGDSCTYFIGPPGVPCTRGGTKYSFYSNTVKRTEAISAFAEATYPFTDKFRFTGGLRYDDTKVGVKQFYYTTGRAACLGDSSVYENVGAAGVTGCTLFPDSGKREFKNTTWKARVEYDVAPEHLLYASVSTGASPGDVGLRTGQSGVPDLFVLTSQTLTSYATGSKNRFLDNKLQLNGEVYYQNYGGFQKSDVLIIEATGPRFISITTPVKYYGFDAEVLYQLTTKDRLGLNVGYTHGWYADQQQVLYTTNTGPVRLGDYIYFKTVENVVPWTVNANYDRRFDMRGGSKLNFHIDVKYTSPFYPSPALSRDNIIGGQAPFAHVSSAYVFNANLMWTSADGKYSINAYARNLFDNRYKTGGSNGCSRNATTGLVTCGTSSATIADPRSLGLVGSVNF